MSDRHRIQGRAAELALRPLGTLAQAATAFALASQACACSNERNYPMQGDYLEEHAFVRLIGNVDNGTQVDAGQYRDMLEVTPALVNDIRASLAGGCSQRIDYSSKGTIEVVGNASGSYSAKTQLQWISASTGVKQRMASWQHAAALDSGSTRISYPLIAVLKKKQMKALAAGDLLRLTGTAQASGTIMDGGRRDEVTAAYSWFGYGVRPVLRIEVP